MVDPTEQDAMGGGFGLETAVQARLNSLDAHNSRRSTKTALNRFVTFLREERGVQTLEELTTDDCRAFAKHLRDLVRRDEISGSTAHQYYIRVQSSCGWWVRDRKLETNPAKDHRAQEELPEENSDRDEEGEQFWSDRQRTRILRQADGNVDEAMDAVGESQPTYRDDTDVLRAYRDRTFVYLLALSGVRGAEVLRDPNDSRRNGLRWQDVTGEGAINILGKSREWEWAPLPESAARVLDKWKTVLGPAGEMWPVLPVLSKGALTTALTDERPDLDIQPTASVRDRLDLFAEHGLTPPAISTNSGRRVLRRLSEDAGFEEPLQPHGARRALGHELYESDPVLAQETLRHKSIETTHSAYRDQRAADRARSIEDVLGDDGDPNA